MCFNLFAAKIFETPAFATYSLATNKKIEAKHGMVTPLRKSIIIASIYSAIGIIIVWFLVPAFFEWKSGSSSMVRLDPQVSKDYNCIYIEGHSAKRFVAPWVLRHQRVQYLRLRYTPNADDQEYGIMFVDPKTMAYEAHNHCVSSPTHLAGRLDTAKPIVDWLDSQPNAIKAASHNEDAREIFQAIQLLSHGDMKHFNLPANFESKNFIIGFHSTASSEYLSVTSWFFLAAFWVRVLDDWIKLRRLQKTQRRFNLRALN